MGVELQLRHLLQGQTKWNVQRLQESKCWRNETKNTTLTVQLGQKEGDYSPVKGDNSKAREDDGRRSDKICYLGYRNVLA